MLFLMFFLIFPFNICCSVFWVSLFTSLHFPGTGLFTPCSLSVSRTMRPDSVESYFSVCIWTQRPFSVSVHLPRIDTGTYIQRNYDNAKLTKWIVLSVTLPTFLQGSDRTRHTNSLMIRQVSEASGRENKGNSCIITQLPVAIYHSLKSDFLVQLWTTVYLHTRSFPVKGKVITVTDILGVVTFSFYLKTIWFRLSGQINSPSRMSWRARLFFQIYEFYSELNR